MGAMFHGVRCMAWRWTPPTRLIRSGMLAALLWMIVAVPAMALHDEAPRLPAAGEARGDRIAPAVPAALPIVRPTPLPVVSGDAVAGDTLIGGAVPWSSLTAPPARGAMIQGGGGSGGGPTIEYYALDALGSVRVVFDAAGAVKARADYEPFGAPVATSTTGPLPREQFTGQQRDGEVGLDYFGARFYHAAHGRMLSVDPLYAGAVADPQRWNRYAYALNSPIVYSDPDGRVACTGTGQGEGFVGGCHRPEPMMNTPSPGMPSLLGCGISSIGGCNYFISQYGYEPEFGSQTLSSPQPAATSEDDGQAAVTGEPDFTVRIEQTIDEVLPVLADLSAGFGDTITFDLTRWVRTRWNIDTANDASWSYFGGSGAGMVWQGLAGGAVLDKAGAFARGGGWLNSNDYLRLGWSWKGSARTGSEVFRVGIGSKRTTVFGHKVHGHITLWPPKAWF